MESGNAWRPSLSRAPRSLLSIAGTTRVRTKSGNKNPGTKGRSSPAALIDREIFNAVNLKTAVGDRVSP